MRACQKSARPPTRLGYTAFWDKYVGAPLNKQLQNGPMSTTKQTITWTETLNIKLLLSAKCV